MANHYIGIVKKVPKQGESLTVRRIPCKRGNSEVHFKAHIIPRVIKVEELQSDDYRTFVVEAHGSFYYVNLIP